MRKAIAVASALVVLLGASSPAPVRAQALDQLALVLSPSEARIGEHVIVRLEGWHSAAVTLTICGNLGLRGTPDCDVVGGLGIGLANSGPTLADLTVSAPPTTCPCVVRASGATSGEAATAPLGIVGAPVGPVTRPSTPDLVSLSAEVTEVRKGRGAAVRALLGGRTQHRVRVTMRNTSNVTLSRVSLGVALGRKPDGAQSVDVPDVLPLKAGETRVYDVPTTLSAPTWGEYLWDVTADGAGPRVRVQVRTSARPWLLYLLAVLLFADLGAFAALRRRRRRERRGP